MGRGADQCAPSVISHSAGAARCGDPVSNGGLDPCFQDPKVQNPEHFNCPLTPWGHDVVQVILSPAMFDPLAQSG